MEVREPDKKLRHITSAGEYLSFCLFFREPRSTLPHPILEKKNASTHPGEKEKSSLPRKEENQWPSKTVLIS